MAGYSRRGITDILGMIVSIGCGLHCVALTMVFLLYPGLWLNRRYWEMGLWKKLLWLEWGLLAAASLLALAAMAAGRRRHRRWGPAIIALLGLGMLAAATLTPLHFQGYRGGALAALGGLLVAAGHWLNLRGRSG